MLLAWSPLYVPHVGAGLPSRLSLRRTHPRGGGIGRHFSLTMCGASLRHETSAVETLLTPYRTAVEYVLHRLNSTDATPCGRTPAACQNPKSKLLVVAEILNLLRLAGIASCAIAPAPHISNPENRFANPPKNLSPLKRRLLSVLRPINF